MKQEWFSKRTIIICTGMFQLSWTNGPISMHLIILISFLSVISNYIVCFAVGFIRKRISFFEYFGGVMKRHIERIWCVRMYLWNFEKDRYEIECSMNGLTWIVQWSFVIVIINWNSFSKWCMNRCECIIEVHKIKTAPRKKANNHRLDRKIKRNKIFQCIYVSMVENRAKPTQTSFEWSLKSVPREAEWHIHIDMHMPRYGPSKHSSFSMRQTLLTLTHAHARICMATNTVMYVDTHTQHWPTHTQRHSHRHRHSHTTYRAYMHNATWYMLPFFICTCGRSITKILELNEFARKSQTVSAAHSYEIAHWTRQHI